MKNPESLQVGSFFLVKHSRKVKGMIRTLAHSGIVSESLKGIQILTPKCLKEQIETRAGVDLKKSTM